MDRLEAMKVFARIVERRSFTKAAEDLALPRSTATDAVKQLEARLGVKLLQRTTRTVAPTLDGEAYYHRCLSILADVEEAEEAFAGAKPKGQLRIDVHGTLARHFVMPHLPEFLAAYPDLDVYMSEGDRLVDLIPEGVDCVLRVGEPQDSDLIARRVAMLDEVTLAAPDYLARHGTPQSPRDLDGHSMVGFRSTATKSILPLEFGVTEVVLPTRLAVNAAESYIAAARLGLGIVQVPRYHAKRDLYRGSLIEILPDHAPEPSPVSLLYPRHQQLSPRVRVFIDWVGTLFREPV
ncbi:LysR family transcriptional regulator [Celeribacter sp.]|uniref:LysR family transcriptional regulator n=1 Tax=Celeribacter sp. TaxID=1890673 RepID=UPI003A922B2E